MSHELLLCFSETSVARICSAGGSPLTPLSNVARDLFSSVSQLQRQVRMSVVLLLLSCQRYKRVGVLGVSVTQCAAAMLLYSTSTLRC